MIKMWKQIRDLLDMDRILEHLERTTDEQWCVEVCGKPAEGVPGNAQFCVRGHLLVYGAFNGMERGFDEIFHEAWATEFMYYAVNDGEDPRYQQATPKQRVIAYFQDLRDGKAKTTMMLMDEWDRECMALIDEDEAQGGNTTIYRARDSSENPARSSEQIEANSPVAVISDAPKEEHTP